MHARYPKAIIAAAAALLLAAGSARATESTESLDRMEAAAASSGTSILHIMFSMPMTNTGVDADAHGTLKGTLTCQKNVNNQRLRLSMSNLDPDATYQLGALIYDDPVTAIVSGLTTDTEGSCLVKYFWKGSGGGVPGWTPLPDALNPTSNVRTLTILNGGMQAVLAADLTDPVKLQYLVMRPMLNTGYLPAATGRLRIKATEIATHVTLNITHLTPNTDYRLSINGIDVETRTSNAAGKLTLTTLPGGAPDVLDINSLALSDAATGFVVLTSGGLGIPQLCDAGSGIPGQAKVNLNSAATFAVLAGSTVTNTGGTTVNGNLGVSPGTAVTGFPPGTVNGTIHAGNSTAAQAQLDLTAAYADAAGRSAGAVGVAGNLGGQTLPPGLYRSTSSLEISSGNLTLDALGDENAVFIFQIASTLTTTAGRQVILSGGAKASNIFWQVGSSATLGTTSVFKGSILALESITLATGATLEGRALASHGAVTLDTNTVGLTVPADTTKPIVSFTDPVNAATGVAVNKKIAAAFSEEMNPLTITPATFTLKRGATIVAGTVTYAGVTATFSPSSDLAANTVYTASVTTGARDLAGNPLLNAFTWSFTTGAGQDTISPTVSSTDPANGRTGVPINKRISAVFSEAMDPLTMTTSTFTLQQGATPVAGAVTYLGVIATFTPSSDLAPNTTYTATINTGARDLAGNSLLNAVAWTFTTGAAPDTTRPIVSFTDPAGAETGVPVNKSIAAVFSEAMDPLTVTTATFTLKRGATLVAGTVTYVGLTATFTPSSDLALHTVYTATITTGAKDLAGNSLLNNFVWSFTTGAASDTTQPNVVAHVPAYNAVGVAINQAINATFSEPMNPLTINTASFSLAGPGETAVAGTVVYDVINAIATFTPASDLLPLTNYTVTISTGAQDLAGNALVSTVSWGFATHATVTVQAPVELGSASTFAVLAASTVTNTGGTMVNGNLGLSPGTAVTGFLPGTVNGTIHAGDAAAAQAQIDLTSAYNDAAGRTVDVIAVAGDLGGQTLEPRVYKSTSSLELSSGDLTLDALGDANAVFIFQVASTLTTAVGRQVILAGGAKASNVFWQVGSSATLGTNSVFKGNILALTSITMSTGATLEGRALTSNGAVTLDTNTITIPSP